MLTMTPTMTTLRQDFFNRPTLIVAEDLLGKVLVRKRGTKVYEGIITEVEAYDGPQDKACHAHKGCTERTKVMFGPAGHWYVYLCYGMHWMLNIVTGEEGYPAAVLVRGIRVVSSRALTRDNTTSWFDRAHHDTGHGPGKLTKIFSIDNTLNAQPAIVKTGLWIEDRGIIISKNSVTRTSRIGVDYAQEWKDKLYRFCLNHD
ncbi:3-methyladenine DNA glycosylase [Candidatus Peregrinibacteria bacterium CG22_combo_CG10-13_8_21_14_all_49_11]|nr:MAG: 3-methyladenine DNA glycosylase [Candidatus Peregrinibacteria bacterium CG22_combo_CG10-13_8_21_14_all_49_11]